MRLWLLFESCVCEVILVLGIIIFEFCPILNSDHLMFNSYGRQSIIFRPGVSSYHPRFLDWIGHSQLDWRVIIHAWQIDRMGLPRLFSMFVVSYEGGGEGRGRPLWANCP